MASRSCQQACACSTWQCLQNLSSARQRSVQRPFAYHTTGVVGRLLPTSRMCVIQHAQIKPGLTWFAVSASPLSPSPEILSPITASIGGSMNSTLPS